MKFNPILLLIITLIFTSSLYARGNIYTTPSDVFKGCAKCHGKDGKNPAFERSEALAGQDVEDLIESINFFKDSNFNGKGVILVMARQVKHLNVKQIENLAIYISKLGRAN